MELKHGSYRLDESPKQYTAKIIAICNKTQGMIIKLKCKDFRRYVIGHKKRPLHSSFVPSLNLIIFLELIVATILNDSANMLWIGSG